MPRISGSLLPGVPRIEYPQGEEARPCRRVFSSRRQPVPLAMAPGPIMGAHSNGTRSAFPRCIVAYTGEL